MSFVYRIAHPTSVTIAIRILNLLAKVPLAWCEYDLAMGTVHNKSPLVNNVPTKQGWEPMIVCRGSRDFDIQQI